MTLQFVKATKHKSKARIAIDGPAGSGKTYTALIAAKVLANGGKVAVIDTERGSASLYSDKFDFDVVELDKFDPRVYVEAINLAESLGYAVIVVDSLSHAWEGEGGVLELHEQATKRQRIENSYTAWRDVTPLHRKLVDTLLQSKCHIIATMRSKMEYEQSKDNNGKTVIKKIGLAPIQRSGTEYEFTIVADMDVDHNIIISKSRCEFMADLVDSKPSEEFFEPLRDWLNSGDDLTQTTALTEVVKNETKPDAPVEMVTIWDGKTQRPANELVSEKAAINFVKTFVKADDAKLPSAHFKNHVHAHFGTEYEISDTYEQIAGKLTWAQMTAAYHHLRDGVDIAPWYPLKKDAPKESSAVTEAVGTSAERPSVDGALTHDSVSMEWKKTHYNELSDDLKSHVDEVMKMVEQQGLTDMGVVLTVLDIGVTK